MARSEAPNPKSHKVASPPSDPTREARDIAIVPVTTESGFVEVAGLRGWARAMGSTALYPYFAGSREEENALHGSIRRWVNSTWTQTEAPSGPILSSRPLDRSFTVALTAATVGALSGLDERGWAGCRLPDRYVHLSADEPDTSLGAKLRFSYSQGIPVLIRRPEVTGITEVAPQALLGLPDRAPGNAEGRPRTVFVVGEGMHALIALTYSAHHAQPAFMASTLEQVIDFFPSVVPDGATVVVYAGPHALAAAQLFRLNELSKRNRGSIHVGIVTALRPSSMSRGVLLTELVNRSPPTAERLLLVSEFFRRYKSEAGGHGLSIGMREKDVLGELQTELAGGNWPSMGHLGHGNFCRLLIRPNVGAICPAAYGATSLESSQTEREPPACVFLGRPCWVKHHLTVGPGHEGSVSTIVVHSVACCTLMFSAKRDPTYNVGINILEGGALAFVGCLSVKVSNELELFVFNSVLERGGTVGEGVARLNDLLEACGQGRMYFVLGDPDLRPRGKLDGARARGKNLKVNDQAVPSRWKLSGLRSTPSLLEFVLDFPPPTANCRESNFVWTHSNDRDLPAVVIRNDKDHRASVLVARMAEDRLEPFDKVMIGGVSSEAWAEIDAVVSGSLRSLLCYSLTRLSPEAIQSATETVRPLLREFEPINAMNGIAPMRFNRPPEEWFSSLDQVADALAPAFRLTETPQNDLMRSVWGNSYARSRRIGGNSTAKCPYCASLLVLKEFSGYIEEIAKRAEVTCLQCGTISEFPAHYFEIATSSDSLPAHLDSPVEFTTGSRVPVKLTVSNYSSEHVRLKAYVCLSTETVQPGPLVHLRPDGFTLPPRESTTLAATLEVPEGATQGPANIKWLLLENLLASAGRKPVIIRSGSTPGGSSGVAPSRNEPQ